MAHTECCSPRAVHIHDYVMLTALHNNLCVLSVITFTSVSIYLLQAGKTYRIFAYSNPVSPPSLDPTRIHFDRSWQQQRIPPERAAAKGQGERRRRRSFLLGHITRPIHRTLFSMGCMLNRVASRNLFAFSGCLYSCRNTV